MQDDIVVFYDMYLAGHVILYCATSLKHVCNSIDSISENSSAVLVQKDKKHVWTTFSL